MKNQIILKAEGELIDNECRDAISKMWTKLESLNERTKAHTIQIKEIEKKLRKFIQLKGGKENEDI
jgi:hypothetical protein